MASLTRTIGVVILASFLLVFLSTPARSAVSYLPMIRVYDGKTLNLQEEFDPGSDLGNQEFSLAAGDVNGDAIDEIVVGASRGQAPKVKIFSIKGKLLNEFLAYDEKFLGGVLVAVGDTMDDRTAEIVTAPGRDGGPHIRIFNDSGVVKSSFMVWPEKYHQGISLTLGNFNQDTKKEIAVARVYDNPKAEVKVFNGWGKDLKLAFAIPDYQHSLNLNLAAIDLGGDGQDELAVNGGYSLTPMVDLRQIDGPQIAAWDVWPEKFLGGVNLAAGDVDFDGQKEIVAGAGVTGGPHIKILDSFGKMEQEFFAGSSDFGGGVKVALGQLDTDPQLEIITTFMRWQQIDESVGRLIKVDVGNAQTLSSYDNGFLIRDVLISSGKGALKTPLGEFSIWRKRPDVHMVGVGYDLPHVPWVLSFKGPYTIHGTYWHANFGHPMSHGCVNTYTPDARWLYDWAKVGDPVIVFQ